MWNVTQTPGTQAARCPRTCRERRGGHPCIGTETRKDPRGTVTAAPSGGASERSHFPLYTHPFVVFGVDYYYFLDFLLHLIVYGLELLF